MKGTVKYVLSVFAAVAFSLTLAPWPECQKQFKPEEQGKCWESIPYQQLRFALATGELVERVDVGKL